MAQLVDEAVVTAAAPIDDDARSNPRDVEPTMPTFVREIAMEPGDERRLAVRPAHRAYVTDLFEQGHIRMSGPLADDTGAVIVYRAASLVEAQALVDADPYVREGVVRDVSLREWNVVIPADA
jgi:uncharacterized protein YciI